MIVAQIMADEPTTEEEFRAFVAREVGRLHADVAKLIAILSIWSQPETVQRYRLLTYGIFVCLVILIILLAVHALLSAGLIGR